MSLDAEPRPSPDEEAGADPEESPENETAGRRPPVGLLVGVAAIGFVALTRPEVITGSFGTVQSTLRVLGLVAAFAVLALLVRRFVTNVWVGRSIVWGLGAVLIAVAVVPSYLDEQVEEDLATSAADLGLDEPAEPAAEDDGAATADGPDEGAPEDPAGDTSEPVAAEEEPAPLPEPVKLTTGQLSGLAGHRGSGEAAVYELFDGTRFVRLENFDVSNGPGIELWVVPRAGAESPDGGTKLADVPGNNGSFNAAIPAEFDTGGDVTILLWCNPVATPMAAATQAPA